MSKKTIAIGALVLFFLTGCSDKTNNESSIPSAVSDTAPQTAEPSREINSATTVEATNEETYTATDEELFYPAGSSNPDTSMLLYNGEKYIIVAGSHQVKIDGKYYELLYYPEEVFIDAERMKDECEYIGESIPNPDGFATPSQELEVTLTDVSGELYKIDENQILLYSTEEYNISDEYSDESFYPGTYRIQRVYLKEEKYQELYISLVVKYYRYKERFPDTYRNWVKLYDLETEE